MLTRLKAVLALISITIAATFVTFAFKVGLLTSIILFFGFPAAYLAWRHPKSVWRSVAFALIMSIPLSSFVDAIAAANGSWIVTHSLFPFKVLGGATVEVLIYSFLWVVYAVLFYEFMFEAKKRHDGFSQHMKYLFFLAFGMMLYSAIGHFIYPELLYIPYFYLNLGLVLVMLPLGLFLWRNPHFLMRFSVLATYFFIILFSFELAALHANQWTFSAGDFLGYIAPFGYRFPLEEFIFWIICATPALLAYYEVFADDRML